MTAYEIGLMLGREKRAADPMTPLEIWRTMGFQYGLDEDAAEKLYRRWWGGEQLKGKSRLIADNLSKIVRAEDLKQDLARAARKAKDQLWYQRELQKDLKRSATKISRGKHRIKQLSDMLRKNRRLAYMIGIPAALATGVGGYYLGRRSSQ